MLFNSAASILLGSVSKRIGRAGRVSLAALLAFNIMTASGCKESDPPPPRVTEAINEMIALVEQAISLIEQTIGTLEALLSSPNLTQAQRDLIQAKIASLREAVTLLREAIEQGRTCGTIAQAKDAKQKLQEGLRKAQETIGTLGEIGGLGRGIRGLLPNLANDSDGGPILVGGGGGIAVRGNSENDNGEGFDFLAQTLDLAERALSDGELRQVDSRYVVAEVSDLVITVEDYCSGLFNLCTAESTYRVQRRILAYGNR